MLGSDYDYCAPLGCVVCAWIFILQQLSAEEICTGAILNTGTGNRNGIRKQKPLSNKALFEYPGSSQSAGLDHVVLRRKIVGYRRSGERQHDFRKCIMKTFLIPIELFFRVDREDLVALSPKKFSSNIQGRCLSAQTLTPHQNHIGALLNGQDRARSMIHASGEGIDQSATGLSKRSALMGPEPGFPGPLTAAEA